MEEREVSCEGGLGSGERNSSCRHHSAHFSLTTPSLLTLIAPLSAVLLIPHILTSHIPTSHTLTPHLHILTPHIPTLHIPIPHIPTLILAPCPFTPCPSRPTPSYPAPSHTPLTGEPPWCTKQEEQTAVRWNEEEAVRCHGKHW